MGLVTLEEDAGCFKFFFSETDRLRGVFARECLNSVTTR